jgi:transcriptional regulator GlxA family with amidase domain
MSQTRFIFLVLPEVHLLDLAGPEQAILESIEFGAPFTMVHCTTHTELQSSAGLSLRPICHFSAIECQSGDYLIVPGARMTYITSPEFRKQTALLDWIQKAHLHGAHVASICSGAFVLGWAGLLHGRSCTTHFQQVAYLQQLFPTAKVQRNCLFTEQSGVMTSAGIASGIDLALHIIEQIMGGHFAHRVARELVVYTRRKGEQAQLSELLAHRNHLHDGIHRAQDYLVTHLDQDTSLMVLAQQANMSERNFTRIFRKETGMSVVEYLNFLRRARINELLNKPDLSRRQIARQCGLRSERHLARLIKSTNLTA